MSYEYNSESKLLDLPNPFKVENFFYFLVAFVMVIAALGLLLVSRSAVVAHLSFLSFFPFLVGVILLALGVNAARNGLSQLRFFFGRGEPQSLAEEVGPSETGKGIGADALKENLRHNALLLKEPEGGMNGLLYNWIPNLIYSPSVIQNYAQRQFYNIWAAVAILLALIICWLSFGHSKASTWMGLFFYIFTLYIIIKPRIFGPAARSKLGINGLISLVLIAILGPVILPFITDNWVDISAVNFNMQSLVILVLSLASNLLFFIALIKQIPSPPPTTTATEQSALSMNGHPKQLMDELDRVLQKNWTEQIPNRSYVRLPPVINHSAGEFLGELLEETQPMPNASMYQIDYKTAMSSPRHQWLIWLDIFGILLACAGVALWVQFAVLLNPNTFNFLSDIHITRYPSLGFALLVLSHYCFSTGHMLWARLDFVSQLIWVEMSGNYQSAKFDHGNMLHDRMRSEKNIINIDNMTLRIWVSELHTVSFDKNSPRFIVGMRGLPEQSTYLNNLLTTFAKEQSVIIAPESLSDLQKISTLSTMNQLAENAAHETAAQLLSQQSGLSKLQCPNCNTLMAKYDKFCGKCGAAANA